MYKPPAGSTYRQCVADYVAVATWRDVVLKDLGFTGVTAALSFITGRLSTRRPTAAAPVGYGKLFVDPSLTGPWRKKGHTLVVHAFTYTVCVGTLCVLFGCRNGGGGAALRDGARVGVPRQAARQLEGRKS